MNDNWQQSPDKKRRTASWVTVFAGIIFVAIGASILAFLLCTQTYVAVTNTTSLPMQNLSIVVAGSEVWSGKLEAGGVIVVANSPTRDGSVSVHATWDGRGVGLLDCGYVTPNHGMVYDLALAPDGTWNSSIESPNPLNMLWRQAMWWRAEGS